MARRTQTYAIRPAVEGGGQVKAELVSVGQSVEQRLKRIETAGERASGVEGFRPPGGATSSGAPAPSASSAASRSTTPPSSKSPRPRSGSAWAATT